MEQLSVKEWVIVKPESEEIYWSDHKKDLYINDWGLAIAKFSESMNTKLNNDSENL